MKSRFLFGANLQVAIFGIVVMAFLPGLASAAWYALGDGDPVTVTVLEDDGNRSVIEIVIGGFDAEVVDIDGEQFYLINLPREGLQKEVGLPQLPNIRRSLIIPDDREMGLRVLASEYVDFPDMPVAPSKGYISRTVDPASVPYTFADFYAGADIYPTEMVEADEPHILRDYRGMVVDANMFSYDPQVRSLRVYTRMVVEVAPIGPGRINVLERTSPLGSLDSQFSGVYENHFLNYDKDTRYAPLEEDGSLLIIAYDAYASFLAPLVEWKNQKGLSTRLVTLSQTGSTYSQIFNYIQTEYQTTDLAYVLLVGDNQHVPKYGSDSDPAYSLLAGSDSYPEIFVGRFSAESPEHVMTQVARTIAYERDTPAGSGSDWLQKGTGIASDQGPGHFGEYDDEHMDYIRTDLLGFGFDQVDQIYDPSASSSQVASAVNAGRGIINYVGHGSTNAWSTSGFSSSNVNALTNDGQLPFIVSVACNNGTFTNGTCFGEAWLRATNGGNATGAIATYMSYISQSWSPPMYAQDEAVDLLIADEKRTIGGLWFNGSCEMMDATGSSGENEFRNWMIFGDPSVCVRTQTAQELVVNHMGSVYIGMDEFDLEVPGVEGALCALYADGVLYGTALTDASGQATIVMANPPSETMDVTLTVTAYNKVTNVEILPVISPSVVLVQPAVVSAGVPTEVTITVLENDGSTPIPDIQIQLTDPMTYGLFATTDDLGQATVTVDYPYGTDLLMVGTHPATGFLFNSGVTVTATPLVDPDLTVLTDPGIEGVFAMNLPGTLSALSGTPEVRVRAQVPGIGFLESASGVLEITPTEPGEVTAWIIKEGFVLYSEVFPIVTQPSAHGIVTLYGEPDHSGVAITAEPGGYTTVTAADGTWHLLNLEVGTYEITAVKDGWSTGNGEVTVAEGEHVTGINFALSQVYRANLCAQPNLEVPSAPSSGASSSMTCVEGGSIDWVRVYVDVSYGWIGYLDVKLTSPSGTTVMLHNQSGGSADDIVGWYPDELTSASDLAAFNGEDLYGDWTLTVQAFAYGATATLNEWCLEISYSPAMSSAGDRDLPKELVLDANYPNPFNPMTTISFALPQATHVQLRVYDLQGKLVATLADGTLTAGRHETIWTGRDDAGRQTASGMYFYRLIADGQIRSGKMLLLK